MDNKDRMDLRLLKRNKNILFIIFYYYLQHKELDLLFKYY